MPKLTVNGAEIEVPAGTTVLQACEAAGIEIPRFCYHERLEIAGNCRMCLVEIEKAPKLVASCAQAVTEGMAVHTDSANVKKAREGVMEFLLINHPLDCPICDQGGECDLQDQAMKYGAGTSRFHENKRAVVDKYMGPLIKTHMTRCIHCTRCVRFLEDIAGTTELGAVGRGEDMQITTYIEQSLSSELSGNIIDLCPVGALTSKPYAFKARSWELKSTESIDVMDAVGSNIRVDSRGMEVMRILPRLNEEINEEWISDKTRFACDGLKYQRLDTPMVKTKGKLEAVTWDQALDTIAAKILKTPAESVGAIAGDLTDVETMMTIKELLQTLGSGNYDCRQNGSMLSNAERASYIFNTTIAGIEKADLCLIIGSNPRHEAAILNARIRKAALNNRAEIALIGEQVNLNYSYKHLGNNPWIIKQLADGDHPFSSALKRAKKPMMIIGADVFAREDHDSFVYHAKKLAAAYSFIQNDWNGYNVLHNAAGLVGGLDIGFVPDHNGKSTAAMLEEMNILFLLGADGVNLEAIPRSTFVIYQGHHGDRAVYRADVILPGAAYTEKDATYVNLEGRVQRAHASIRPPGQAKVDWEVIVELSKKLKKPIACHTLEQVRARMAEESSIFQTINIIRKESISLEMVKIKSFSIDYFLPSTHNFYMTNSIARNSRTMAKCIEASLDRNREKAA